MPEPKFDKCPICGLDYKYCPHSFREIENQALLDNIRKIVREELERHAAVRDA